MYLSMIEYSKYDWHAAFGHKRLCCRHATAVTFILNLLYKGLVDFGCLKKLTDWDAKYIKRSVLVWDISLYNSFT